MRNFRKREKGITLVALVVTIVVLLILAGISLSLILGNYGVITKANEGRTNYANASVEEQTELNTAAEWMDNFAEGKETTPTTSTATLPAGTYTVGQEVTFGDEQFFVVADDGNSVRLLAKYCLNLEGTAQTDKDATAQTANTTHYGRQFSNSPYWTDENLQSEENIAKANADGTTIQNAILTAIKYGEDKGVTGRLMTLTEANTMVSSNSAIIYGKWTDGTQPQDSNFTWWLANVYEDDSISVVDGSFPAIGYEDYDVRGYGVRPVLVVPEA